MTEKALENLSRDCVGKDVLHHGHKVGEVISSEIKKEKCFIKMELIKIKKEQILSVGPLGEIKGWSGDKIYKFELDSLIVILKRS